MNYRDTTGAPGEEGGRWQAILRRVTTGGPHLDERLNQAVLSVLVLLGIVSVAITDWAVGREISLAPIYFAPLALSALVHPLEVSLVLSLISLLMHHVLEYSATNQPHHLTYDLLTLTGYVFVVVVVNLLGRQRSRMAELARQQRDELAREIQLAVDVQQSILPRRVPSLPGFDIAARMYPAKMVAGDYYGFLELEHGNFALVIADVSGKGVAAGLLMPSIEVALRLDSPQHAQTERLIEAFNKVVCQLTAGHRFISLFYGKFEPRTLRLEYTNAGHNPPLLLRPGATPRPLNAGGPVLGVLADAVYESDLLQLQQGEVLVLYTDGVVEAENANGESYSMQRLAETAMAHLAEPAQDIMEAIYKSVVAFRGHSTLDDDATVMVVKVL